VTFVVNMWRRTVVPAILFASLSLVAMALGWWFGLFRINAAFATLQLAFVVLSIAVRNFAQTLENSSCERVIASMNWTVGLFFAMTVLVNVPNNVLDVNHRTTKYVLILLLCLGIVFVILNGYSASRKKK